MNVLKVELQEKLAMEYSPILGTTYGLINVVVDTETGEEVDEDIVELYTIGYRKILQM
jgi:hypothetical protein